MRGTQLLKSGFSYLFIGSHDKALNAFRKAIESDPDNAEYAFHGSMTAWRNGEYDLARKWAQRAVNTEPKNQLYQEHLDIICAYILLQQAKTAVEEGKTTKAQALLRKAMSKDPLNQQAEALYERLQSHKE
ncbi:tetratricopeptide repeat protein [Alicyclobacillus sp. SO9]|uniref:tetratricopeptide repeat protein n=1 Tax=Alicyclobacillus sp. SO9 TaxID=2665646 RepID=UPI0018E802CC|nr:tetratricopeptide repeat protein [Alicyclobacillus sp. SO9]QQE76785.1 tetratricopeptide repeat protein [Alicyclobacillus sp. SO9]